MSASTPDRASRPNVVIVGGGFGGLACAKALGGTDIDVMVVDRRNHNLFQPLLYQVATAALSPADISEPIRRTLGRYSNIRVLLGEVSGIDRHGQRVELADGTTIPYDYLVLATGSVYNYFAHSEWQSLAPGLKSIHEARLIRQRLLMAYELAEKTTDTAARKALLTSVVIGGGPTGIEMAGAICELGRYMVERDFRNVALDEIRIILIEAGPRILAAFPDRLACYAQDHLEHLGIEIRLGQRVMDVRPGAVAIGEEIIPCGCIIWGAGIKPSPAASWLGFDERSGKVPVDAFLRVAGWDDVFAIGDTAQALDLDGAPVARARPGRQAARHLCRRADQNGAARPINRAVPLP